MMRPFFYVISFLALIGLGAWAYKENYATQAMLREVRGLETERSYLREALTVQRAEWAYLNRPDRLRELVTLNFDRLGLMQMEPSQFGAASDIAYPAPDAGIGQGFVPQGLAPEGLAIPTSAEGPAQKVIP
jgi:hypothetical protein